MEFRELNLRNGISGIKFERNWNFKNHLRIGVLEIKLWKLESWKSFEDDIFKNK